MHYVKAIHFLRAGFCKSSWNKLRHAIFALWIKFVGLSWDGFWWISRLVDLDTGPESQKAVS
jgi:hypothetical protein